MSNLNAFLAQNVKPLENRKVVISSRFKDEKGKPIEWEIKAITCDENEDLQRRAMVQRPVAGQRGAMVRELDQIKYTSMLLAASVVYPDLNNAALQDSYGVKTPEALLNKMLYITEQTKLANEVQDLSNLDNLADLVKEAKN